MAEYYAITRSDDFLEHYGIKGMKWGVRKAIQSGNTRALGRQYRKAQRKLAKLEKRANSGAKYARRAAALGAAAGVAGGAAALGTTKVGGIIARGGGAARKGLMGAGSAINKAGLAAARYGQNTGNSRLRNLGLRASLVGNSIHGAGNKVGRASAQAGIGLHKWGNSQSALGKAAHEKLLSRGSDMVAKGYKTGNDALIKRGNDVLRKSAGAYNVTKGQLARIGAGAAAAGLAGAAGYNAYRAATTKRAARKAAEFRSEMNKAFAGTQYANGGRGGNRRRRRR